MKAPLELVVEERIWHREGERSVGRGKAYFALVITIGQGRM